MLFETEASLTGFDVKIKSKNCSWNYFQTEPVSDPNVTEMSTQIEFIK